MSMSVILHEFNGTAAKNYTRMRVYYVTNIQLLHLIRTPAFVILKANRSLFISSCSQYASPLRHVRT